MYAKRQSRYKNDMVDDNAPVVAYHSAADQRICSTAVCRLRSRRISLSLSRQPSRAMLQRRTLATSVGSRNKPRREQGAQSSAFHVSRLPQFTQALSAIIVVVSMNIADTIPMIMSSMSERWEKSDVTPSGGGARGIDQRSVVFGVDRAMLKTEGEKC